MDPGLGNFIGMGVQALGSGLGAIFTNNAIKKENQKNREWNEKMWNLNNEYNSPVEQMKRYREAGLSENLVYGSTQNSQSGYAGNLGTSENFKNPMEGVNLNFADVFRLKNETKVANSTANKNDADAFKATKEAENVQKDIDRKSIELNYADANQIIDLLKKGQDYEAIQLANSFAKDANEKKLAILNEELENAKKDGLIKEEQKNQIIENVNLIKAEQKTEEAKQANLKDQAAMYRAEAYKAREEGKSEKYRRALMASQIAENEAMVGKIQAAIGVDKVTAKKIVAETAKTYMEMERDKYGKDYKEQIFNAFRITIERHGFHGAITKAMDYIRDEVSKFF